MSNKVPKFEKIFINLQMFGNSNDIHELKISADFKFSSQISKVFVDLRKSSQILKTVYKFVKSLLTLKQINKF